MDVWTVPEKRQKGWYLDLMAPNVKGPKYAWLDPSRLYCNKQGLQDCIEDLLEPFQGETIDLVAGIDAMGFILGSAIATSLGKGFLAIRKSGHLCVKTHSQDYTDYSGREKAMEVRTDVLKAENVFSKICNETEALPTCLHWATRSALAMISSVCWATAAASLTRAGVRVLIVDQWVETGGTMKAAIKLVEQQGAVVVGVAAVCIENSEGGHWIRERYKHSHCVPSHLQPQFDQQSLHFQSLPEHREPLNAAGEKHRGRSTGK